MKRVIILSIAALVIASTGFAQTGAICLFADPAGTDCTLTDDGPGLLSIYVVHTLTPGAMASQFWAPKPSCMVGATYLGDNSPFPVAIGDSQTGIAVGYGSCQTGPVHILTINYQVSGGTLDDCAYYIRPHPNVSNIEAVDCNENVVNPGGGKIYLNSDQDCLCAEFVGPEMYYSPQTMDFQDGIDALPLTIVNLGGGTLTWTAVDALPWIEVAPQNGVDDGTVTVSVDRDNLTVGEHTGQVFLNSNGGTAEVPVRLDVIAALLVTPAILDFGNNVSHLYIYIHNAGSGIMNWNLSVTEPWMSLAVSSGQGDRAVLVTIDRSGLNGGTYTGYIHATSDGGGASVLVTMNVGAVLSVDPGRLDFGYYSTVQYLDIENTGTGLLSWAVTSSPPWVTVIPTAGENDGTLEITANRLGLADGHHEGVIAINSNGGEALIPVTIDVGPSLYLTPTTLVYSGIHPTLTFRVRNIGAGTLNWTLDPDWDWISVDPVSGTDDATIEVTVDRCALAPGILHEGAVHVTSNGGNGTVLILAHSVPRLGVSTDYLEFKEHDIEFRTFRIEMLCTEPFDWTATTQTPWITLIDPASGSGPDTVLVSVDWPEGVEEPELWGAIQVNEVGGPEQVTIAVRFYPADILVPTEKKTWGSLKSKFKK